MGEYCKYCHVNWEKRVPIKETDREVVLLGVTDKLEIEIEDILGFTVFTTIETETCPKCSRYLKGYSKELEEVKDEWGEFYLREDIEKEIKGRGK